jgi:aryl-alcohol dehydrogenase
MNRMEAREISAAVGRTLGQSFEIERVTLDAPQRDEVLVRLVATGMCHTDLAVRDGDIPFPPRPHILGHEGAGVVAEVGPGVTQLQVGDAVVMSYASCGQCARCAAGQPYNCVAFLAQNFGGVRADGSGCHHQHGERIFGNFFGQSSFATHALARQHNLVKVPAEAPLELLGPLGCGVLTGAGAVMNALRPPPGSSLVVFGLGAVGMSALMAGKLLGCRTIIGVDLHPARLALAREIGATHTIDAGAGKVTEQGRELTGGGADYMVEAVGKADLIDPCIAALRSRGAGVLLGAQKAGKIVLDATNLMRGISLKSVIEGEAAPRVLIPQLIEFQREGRFPFDRLIRAYDFADINVAADDLASGRTIKPVLRMRA